MARNHHTAAEANFYFDKNIKINEIKGKYMMYGDV
jgi:hypothetical protein